jgi:hypothetical protein
MEILFPASLCRERGTRSAKCPATITAFEDLEKAIPAKRAGRPSVTGGPSLTGVRHILSKKTSRNPKPSRRRQKVQRAEAPAHLQILAAIALSYL